MPQLDITCYFPQLLFIILSFFCFYFYIIYYLLPQISYVLKIRKKLILKQALNFLMIKKVSSVLINLENLIYKDIIIKLNNILYIFIKLVESSFLINYCLVKKNLFKLYNLSIMLYITSFTIFNK